MGERKVLNKYYPPDFDPDNLPRCRMPKDRQMKVRMMLPMSLRCKTCGTFMYKGTKFNSRKEDVIGETYLGIQIYRFYFRCSNCSSEMTMKTDPQNHDYEVELGATRNYEHWRENEKVTEEVKKKREEEEKGNAMKGLENGMFDSRREMDLLSALDELKSLNARKQKVSYEQLLVALKNNAEGEAGGKVDLEIDEEDEAAIRKLFYEERSKLGVKRLQDDDDNDVNDRVNDRDRANVKGGGNEVGKGEGSSIMDQVRIAGKPKQEMHTMGTRFIIRKKKDLEGSNEASGSRQVTGKREGDVIESDRNKQQKGWEESDGNGSEGGGGLGGLLNYSSSSVSE